MNITYINITLIIFIIIFLALGITFAVMKVNNDEYIKTKLQTDPNFTNNYSEIYLGLTITFFILFFLLSIWLVFILKSKKNTNTPYNTPIFKPLMSLDTPPGDQSDTTTPYSLKTYQNIDKNISKFPNLDELEN